MCFKRLLGTYEALEGGELADALIDFTGGLAECLELNLLATQPGLASDVRPLSRTPRDERTLDVSCSLSHASHRSAAPTTSFRQSSYLCEYIYKILLRNQLGKTLIAAAISTDDPDEQERETELGLVVGHAYAVTRLCTIPIKPTERTPNRQTDSVIRLVRLMNPWGHGTWRGAFCKGSPDWELIDHKSLCLDSLGEGGEFWMRFEDFLEQFNYVVLCHTPLGGGASTEDKPWFQFMPSLSLTSSDLVRQVDGDRTLLLPSDQSMGSGHPFRLGELWTDFTLHSSWTSEMSGGCLNCTDTFVNNPQFAFDVLRRPSTSVILYLFQKTERTLDRLASSTGLYHIGMSVFRVEANRLVPIYSLNEPVNLVVNSVYRNSRVVWIRLNRLPYGRYVVIPTTFYPNCMAEFMLRLVGPPPLSLFELERDAKHLAPSGPRRSKSAMLYHSQRQKLKHLGCCFLKSRQTVYPLNKTISKCIALHPPPKGMLRLTIFQSVVWSPFLSLFSGDQDSILIPSYYANVSVDGHHTRTGLHDLHLFKSGGDGQINNGVIQFKESFLFHNKNNGTLRFRFQLRIYHPVFDEQHSEFVGMLAHPASGDSHPMVRHLPLFAARRFSEKQHSNCIRTDSTLPYSVDPLSLPDHQHSQNYRAAFRQSELLLLNTNDEQLSSNGQTYDYPSDGRCGLLTFSLEC